MTITVAHLLEPLQLAVRLPYSKQAVSTLCLDSRKAVPDSVFIALRRSQPTPESDAQTQHYIRTALDAGAVCVLTEPETAVDDARVLAVVDLPQWVGPVAERFYTLSRPAPQRAQIAAVTGTNGKTTIARLLGELLAAQGSPTAVLGTTGNGLLPHLNPSTHTTLDAVTLQGMLNGFEHQGAQFVCLEASSHGLDQGRLAGTPIAVAIFSNLTRDHLDYHHTLEHYALAKARLFAWPSLHTAILNADDPASDQMAAACGRDVRLWRYSMTRPDVDWSVETVRYSLKGAELTLRTPYGPLALSSPILGQFNVSNLLAAVAAASALGLSLERIQAAVPVLLGAEGRMQVIDDPDRLLVVDYAHTPDALDQVLQSTRVHMIAPHAQLHCVIGCGGDRDRGKRPLMLRAALERADRVIVTADNPRSESVQGIVDDMLTALTDAERHSGRVTIELERRRAIQRAVSQLQRGDALVVAGKGHETYQEIRGVRHAFDDRVELTLAQSLYPAP